MSLVPSAQMVAAANDAQVLLVWALDAVHTSLIATSLWNYFSLGFGDASQTDLSDTYVPSPTLQTQKDADVRSENLHLRSRSL